MFENLDVNRIYKVILSSPSKTSPYKKATIKRITIKEREVFQIESFTDKQAFHENISQNDLITKLEGLVPAFFSQAQVFDSSFIYGYRVTSKGKLLSNKVKNTSTSFVSVSHNKEKKYLLKEGTPIPALIELGVMNSNGEVNKSYYDKFKQINRFIEIIDDTLKNEEKKHLNIIDFGCGKSYLTFILYYYLIEVKKISVNIIGLDLKEDVIKECNRIRDKYNYSNLNFEIGDISLYKPKTNVDLIITLHACDTATDYAMYHAIKLNVKYLLSVPCCQHEVNGQIEKNDFELINKYGILKERFSALLTDSIRANLLEYEGYKTQVMEFVDYGSSPKNLLIRAVKKTNEKNIKAKELVEESLKRYDIKQTLYELLTKE